MTYFNRFSSLGFFFVVLITTLFYSCSPSEEEDISISEENLVPFEISAIVKGEESIHQLDILGDTSDIEVTDLSQTLGVPYDIRSTYINDSKVTFFDNQNRNYAFWQKDLVSGQSISGNPLCELTEYETLRFPLTSGDQTALITSEFNGVDVKSYLNVYDTSSTCNRFEIADFYIQQNRYAHLHNGRFYLFIQELGGDAYSLKIIDASNGQQEEKFTFDSNFRATMNDERLYVMLVDGSYKIFDLQDLNLIEEGETNNEYLHFVPGIHKSNTKGSKMVFDYTYPQPTRIGSAPAIYDWNTNEMTRGGDFYLLDVIRELEDTYIEGFEYTAVEIDLETEILVAGYRNVRDNNEGGIVYFTFEGEILIDIPLDYVPFSIMIRD
jgi:hypothetical protein